MLGERAAGHRGLAGAGRQRGQPPSLAADRRRSAATASRAISISAVSSTSWLVRPRCSHRAASGCSSSSERSSATSADHRVAARLGSSTSHSSWRLDDPPGRPSRRRRDPGSTRASSQATSTATIASRKARRENSSPARWSPARRGRSSRSVSRVGSGRRSPGRPAGARRTRSQSRPASAISVERRSASSAWRNGSSPGLGQVGAGEQPVEQPAREDGHREERRARLDGRERVAALAVGGRASPAGEGVAVAPQRARLLHHVTVGVGLPELEDARPAPGRRRRRSTRPCSRTAPGVPGGTSSLSCGNGSA